MIRPARFLFVAGAALALAACGDDARQAGGVSKSEAEALDDAAEMVEQQRPGAVSTDAEPGAATESAPGPAAT